MFLLSFIENSTELQIFLVSILPIVELRGSIPYFIITSDIHWFLIFLIAVISSICTGTAVRLILGPVILYLDSHRLFSFIIRPVLKRTATKLETINKYKLFGLVLFIAIPLPVTGVWTGALASCMLSMNRSKALSGIALGSILSGVIVTAITLTSIEIATMLIPNFLIK